MRLYSLDSHAVHRARPNFQRLGEITAGMNIYEPNILDIPWHTEESNDSHQISQGLDHEFVKANHFPSQLLKAGGEIYCSRMLRPGFEGVIASNLAGYLSR